MISRRAMGAGAAVAVARIFSLLMAALQLPVLARSLTPTDFAAASVVIAAAAYFSLATAEPHTLAFQRHPGSPEAIENFSIAARRIFAWSAVGIVVAVIGGALTRSLEVSLATAGWGLGMAVTRLVSTAWLSWLKPWHYSFNLMASTGVRTGILLLLLLTDAPVWVALMSAGMASAAAAIVVGPPLWKLFVRRTARPPWTLAFGLNLTIASLFYAVLTNVSLLVLPALASSRDVAPFAAMLQVSTISAGAILGLVVTTMYPYVRAGWDAGFKALTRNRLDGVAVGIVSLTLVSASALTAGDGLIAKAIVGHGLTRADLLTVMVAGLMFASLGMIENWKHQLMLRSGTVAVRGLIAAAIGVTGSVVLPVLMAPSLGAAFAFLLGFLAYYCAMAWGNDRTNTGVAISLTAGVVLASSSLLRISANLEAMVLLLCGLGVGFVSATRFRVGST